MSDVFPDGGHTFPTEVATTEHSPAFLPRGTALSVLWLYDASEARSSSARSTATDDRHDARAASDARDACP